MNRKQLIRTVCFFVLLFFVLVGLSDVFETKNSDATERYALFKSFEPDMIDCAYVGGSAVFAFLIPSQVFDEYGYSIQPMACSAMGAQGVLPYLKEAQRLQNPELYLIDIHPFVKEQDAETANSWGRTAIDAMDFFSPNRLEFISRTQNYLHLIDPENYGRIGLGLFFPFLQDHGMWQQDDFKIAKNLGRQPSEYLGAYVSKSHSVHIESIPSPAYTDALTPLGEVQEQYLRELIAYLQDNRLNAVFINTPHGCSKSRCAKINTAVQILQEYGMAYKDFNAPEIFDAYFDPDHDFYNANHTNYYGAIKYTRLLCEYLHENFSLPDRRTDARYAGWHGVNDRLRAKMDELSARQAE